MGTHYDSRFDADKVTRLATFPEKGRLEMQFRDAYGKEHVVSLPVRDAVTLGCLICDASKTAPYLIGGVKRQKTRKPA